MDSGIRRWALIAYLGLCIYLLAQPSPIRLVDRAKLLDKNLSDCGRATLAPAMAAALDMSLLKVDSFLTLPNSKPSDLVFQKLVERCGSVPKNDTPAYAILKSGMPTREALNFFDGAEKRITDNLAKDQKVEAVLNPRRDSPQPSLAHSLRSEPD